MTIIQQYLKCAFEKNSDPLKSYNIYRITAALKMETDIINSSTASPFGRVVIPVIMYVCGARVIRSLVFCVVFCRPLFVFLSFFLWQLCCLSFDLRILITSLISSNYSFSIITYHHNIYKSYDMFVLQHTYNTKVAQQYIY